MSLSKEKDCQRKPKVSQPLLLVVSSTLLATCNGAALALEGIEAPLSIQNSSFPSLQGSAQTTSASVVPSTEPAVQFSPYTKIPVQIPDSVIEPAGPVIAIADDVIHSDELAENITEPTPLKITNSSQPIEQFQPSAELPMRFTELVDSPIEPAPLAVTFPSRPIESFQPSAELPFRVAELTSSPAPLEAVSSQPIERFQPSAELPVRVTQLADSPAEPAAPETITSQPIEQFRPTAELPTRFSELANAPVEQAKPESATNSSQPIGQFQPSAELPVRLTQLANTPAEPANETVVSQVLEAEESDSEAVSAPISYNAADLLDVPARFGVNASTATNGFGETIGVHGFVPLDQDIDEDLDSSDITFLEGNLQVNDGDPSFSLSLGHRGYRQDKADPDDEYIRGGYVGVDGRFTDESSFFQLATGYERINDDWEFRINGYLPIGDRTNTIQSVDFNTGLQTDSEFSGNELVLSAVLERQRILIQEDALGGFDAEFGAKLADWDGGELMGYAGGYLLSGEDSSLGGQLRLAANFESNFNVGLSLQHDAIFDTTVALSLRATWPQFRFQDKDEADFANEFEVPIRLRDSIARRQTVAVNFINEEEIILEEDIQALQNPEEEEDYRFVHVNLGGPEQDGTAGPGTYENPFATVEDAIALINSDPATYNDGNTIVYVDGENAPGITIPGFTIPDRVRVLSQGPEQVIGGIEFPGFPSVDTRLPFASAQNFNVASDAPNANGITVALPDSGDGAFPIITGGSVDDLVTLGNNTVLAGFQIDGATQHGVAGSDINNVELRNNLISNSGGSGIFFNNVGGSAILFDNVVNNSVDRGIFVENTTTTPLEIAIAGFDLNNNRVGMDFSNIATAGVEVPSQIIWIGPSVTANTSTGTPGGTPLTNSILNSTAEGLVLRAEGDGLTASSSQQLAVIDTTIDQSGGDGLQVIADVGVHQQLFGIDNSTITNSGGNGITIVNGDTAINGSVTPTTPDAASPQEIVIVNSEIINNALDGIDITLTDAGAQELVIQDNQIIGNGGNGIDSTADTATVQEWRTDNETGALGVSGNTISGNGGQAITIDLENVATLPIVGIGNNDLSGNGVGPDIEINTQDTFPAGSVNACLVVTDNTAPQSIVFTAPDPVLSSGIPSVQVEDLPNLNADTNVFLLVDDVTLGLIASTAAYTLPPSNCNE
ncbi:MAG: hypothetical protein KTR27_07135 [Leptolyngbyaceae cyanobacterium MAG.088]|nr:hypothetical protein [Leptolyngbyaceae cyanobacterium MAG.088]